MLDTFTRRARPTAASHAANTRIVMGIGMEAMELEFSVDSEVIINKESIIPSKQRSVDIRWERNIRVPRSDRVNARVRLRKVDVIFGNYDCDHNLMSRNH